VRRVLRRDDEEGFGEPSRLAFGRDLVLLHRSSSADWVLGVARFTSSARISCEKIGPAWNLKVELSRSYTDTPMMSAGSMSLVNWMRWKLKPEELRRAPARAWSCRRRQSFDQEVPRSRAGSERRDDLALLAENYFSRLLNGTP